MYIYATKNNTLPREEVEFLPIALLQLKTAYVCNSEKEHFSILQ
jgi:hypothetical protein